MMRALILILFLFGCVRGDIAECRMDTDCDLDLGECCARVIVSDSVRNSIDSHYCL